MTATATWRRPRGGNRLPPHARPVVGPRYPRRRVFGPDAERRDRNQSERVRKAADKAIGRGELTPILYAVLLVLIAHSDVTLLKPGPSGDGRLCSGWWRLRTIHKFIYPHLHEGLDPDKENVGARTAGGWMAELVRLGWVEKIHRSRVVHGEPMGTSNLWRLCIPEHLRAEVTADEDKARSKAGKKRPKNRRPGKPTGAPAVSARPQPAPIEPAEPVSANACPVCHGRRWVVSRTDRRHTESCGTCGGTGVSGGP